MPKECRDLITRDKEYCKTKPEFMKENCASTCEYCGMRPNFHLFSTFFLLIGTGLDLKCYLTYFTFPLFRVY